MTDTHLWPTEDAIGLAPERCGPRRGSELPGPERALYRWILRHFATAGPPSPDEVEDAAAAFGAGAGDALAAMERIDLVRLEATGAVACAYPFSALPTSHTVDLDGMRPPVHAMCAIDALGIPLMLHRPAVIGSFDPDSGRALTVTVDADGVPHPDPSGLAVVVASADRSGPLASRCCPLITLVESAARGDAHLAARPHLTGAVLALPAAMELARTVFGGVLD